MNLETTLELYGQRPQSRIETGIHWGSREFSRPVKLDVINELLQFMPETAIPGLYVIMIRDPHFPGGFRPIWFGEAKDIYERARTHEERPKWLRFVKGETLYVSYHHMFFSTEKERWVAESNLITRYKRWLCNQKLSVAK